MVVARFDFITLDSEETLAYAALRIHEAPPQALYPVVSNGTLLGVLDAHPGYRHDDRESVVWKRDRTRVDRPRAWCSRPDSQSPRDALKDSSVVRRWLFDKRVSSGLSGASLGHIIDDGRVRRAW